VGPATRLERRLPSFEPFEKAPFDLPAAQRLRLQVLEVEPSDWLFPIGVDFAALKQFARLQARSRDDRVRRAMLRDLGEIEHHAGKMAQRLEPSDAGPNPSKSEP
jgi:hypothetical protein